MNINYSTDITDVATERETDGDLILSDIGEGLYIEYIYIYDTMSMKKGLFYIIF